MLPKRYLCFCSDRVFKKKKTWLFVSNNFNFVRSHKNFVQHLKLHQTGQLDDEGRRILLPATKVKAGTKRTRQPRDIYSPAVPQAKPKKPKLSKAAEKEMSKNLCSICNSKIKLRPENLTISNYILNSRKPASVLNTRLCGRLSNGISDTLEIWFILTHQLRHNPSFSPTYSCDDCNFKTKARRTIRFHVKDRKDCPMWLENRIEALYQSSEKRIEGKRAFFKCCKCDWAKTTRSDETFR